ncbi:MAG TPA: YraN family protein [Bacteroidales bacterium]|nr:YraN family protein [Bacteroidales bacterium]
MSQSSELGIKGEEFAADFLKKNGYRILSRNFRFGKYEIDIIAENNEFLVFAEVKTRAYNPLDPPANAVTRDKQKAMIWAAEAYIKRYRIDKESRFDVIIVLQKDENDFSIEHIPYAFYPSLR